MSSKAEPVRNVRVLCESIIKIEGDSETENGKRWKCVREFAERVLELLDGGQP